jgi:hypothetical protein
MIVLATGFITRPDALEPHLDHEMRVLRDLKAEGVVKSAYRRSAGPGFYFILEGPSIDSVREQIDATRAVRLRSTFGRDESRLHVYIRPATPRLNGK